TSYGQYLLKAFWPSNISVLYPLPLQVAWGQASIAVIVLVIITAFSWSLRHSRPHLLVGWLWFLGTLVPVIGIVQVGGQAMADRYTYLPMIGVTWALVWECACWVKAYRWPAWLPATIAGCVLLALSVRTLKELSYWRDSETLFERALEVTTNNAVAHINLGVAYETAGKLHEAAAEYEKAIQINPLLAPAT